MFFPPTKDIGEYIILKREPESPSVVIIFPNQDSYELDGGEELETYLKLLKIPEHLKLRDYVWNFYGAKLDFIDMRMERLTQDQAASFIKKADKEVAF